MRTMKQVTIISLKRGEELQVSLEEGNKARAAKLRGSGVIVIPSQRNRVIDVVMIGDIQDKWVEDIQQSLVVDDKARLLDTTIIPEPATETSPGYLKFKEAQQRLKERMGRPTRQY